MQQEKNKLETIRRIANRTGNEECTFKPKLISNRRTRDENNGSWEYSMLASVSIQKYIARMDKAREIRERPQLEARK